MHVPEWLVIVGVAGVVAERWFGIVERSVALWRSLRKPPPPPPPSKLLPPS